MCFETKRLPLRCQRNIFGRKRGNSEYVEEMEQDIDDTVLINIYVFKIRVIYIFNVY